MKDGMKEQIKQLREKAKTAYVASVDEAGYPQVKAMFVLEHESMEVQYFSTNLSSHRAQAFLKNPKASVYYCNTGRFRGALFTGEMTVCTDYETKAALWRSGFEMYYPKGIEDADYCVLKFTAKKINYYHGLANETIPIEAL